MKDGEVALLSFHSVVSHTAWVGQYAYGAKLVYDAFTSFTLLGLVYNVISVWTCWYAQKMADELKVKESFEDISVNLAGNVDRLEEHNNTLGEQLKNLRKYTEDHKATVAAQKRAQDRLQQQINQLEIAREQTAREAENNQARLEEVTLNLQQTREALRQENQVHAGHNQRLGDIIEAHPGNGFALKTKTLFKARVQGVFCGVMLSVLYQWRHLVV